MTKQQEYIQLSTAESDWTPPAAATMQKMWKQIFLSNLFKKLVKNHDTGWA